MVRRRDRRRPAVDIPAPPAAHARALDCCRRGRCDLRAACRLATGEWLADSGVHPQRQPREDAVEHAGSVRGRSDHEHESGDLAGLDRGSRIPPVRPRRGALSNARHRVRRSGRDPDPESNEPQRLSRGRISDAVRGRRRDD